MSARHYYNAVYKEKKKLMTINIGAADRVIRYILGLFLILAPLWNQYILSFAPLIVAASVVVGIVLVVTAYVRSCPIYTALGASTRQK